MPNIITKFTLLPVLLPTTSNCELSRLKPAVYQRALFVTKSQNSVDFSSATLNINSYYTH